MMYPAPRLLYFFQSPAAQRTQCLQERVRAFSVDSCIHLEPLERELRSRASRADESYGLDFDEAVPAPTDSINLDQRGNGEVSG